MHIGILKTDTVRPEWVGEYGEYPDMFMCLLNEAQEGLRFSVWDAEAGVLPNDDEIDSVCGFIITGTEPKAVVIRARGPGMAEVDPNLAGALLEDPYVQLFSGATLIAQNDDWALIPVALIPAK